MRGNHVEGRVGGEGKGIIFSYFTSFDVHDEGRGGEEGGTRKGEDGSSPALPRGLRGRSKEGWRARKGGRQRNIKSFPTLPLLVCMTRARCVHVWVGERGGFSLSPLWFAC